MKRRWDSPGPFMLSLHCRISEHCQCCSQQHLIGPDSMLLCFHHYFVEHSSSAMRWPSFWEQLLHLHTCTICFLNIAVCWWNMQPLSKRLSLLLNVSALTSERLQRCSSGCVMFLIGAPLKTCLLHQAASCSSCLHSRVMWSGGEFGLCQNVLWWARCTSVSIWQPAMVSHVALCFCFCRAGGPSHNPCHFLFV